MSRRIIRHMLTQIRRATPGDARAIAVIHVESSWATYRGLIPDGFLSSFTVERREAGWRQSLEAGECEVWIAEQGGHPLGWICAGRSRDDDAEPTTAELWAMYVDPSSWRRGIGRALWSEAQSHLDRAGFSRATLWVFRDNGRAIAFYRSVGFTEEAGKAKTRDRGGVALTEIRMQLTWAAAGGEA